MRLVWIACVAFACACGGKIDTGGDGEAPAQDGSAADSPSQSDVTVAPDGAMVTCQLGMGSGTVGSNGSCSSSQSFTCGATAYDISCSCPESACTCTMGTQSHVLLTTVGCPSCDVTNNIDKLAQLCGFPPP